MNTFFKNNAISIFLPAFLLSLSLFLAYSNSFNSPFYFDDYGYVVGNSHIEISSLSFENLQNAALKSPIPKRVLPNISFALNYYFSGGGVFGFHLVNFALHLITSLAVFFLFKTTLTLPFFKKNIKAPFEISLLASLIWACHPLQTNAVTYLVQRMTCMATLFTVASLLCYVKGRISGINSGKYALAWFAASIIFGIMALLSKENSAMLPVLIIAYELFFLTEINWERDRKRIILLLSAACALLLLFSYIYLNGNLTSFFNYSSRSFTLEERLLTEMRVVLFYLSLFFLPLPSRLTLFHDFPISHSFSNPPQTIFALFTLILLAAGIVFFYKRARLLSFAIFWYLANLVIESSVIPLEIIYEHRAYLPTIFLPLIFVVLLYRTVPHRIAGRSFAAIVVCLLVFFTWQRNEQWSDSVIFMQDAAAKAPNNSRTHLGLYFALQARGMENEAFVSLQKAFEADPGNVKALAPLVRTYNDQKRFSSSLAAINRHLAVKETDEGYIERAKIHAMQKNMPMTLRDAEKALLLNPKSAIALLIKGKALTALGKHSKALEALSEARNRGLDSAILYISIGEVYINSGKTELAIHYFEQGIKRDPNSASGHYYLGLAYGKAGRKEEAGREMAIGQKLNENPVQKSTNPHNF